MTVRRLGILGGSFNPVHLGHLHIAQYCRDIFGLSQVLFVVASQPPHKPAQELVPFAHRFAMVSLATSGIDYFLPSPAELDPPASPYSIDTLVKLSDHLGVDGRHLFFIAGGDSLLEVAGWHEAERLLLSYQFVFVMRPGVENPDICAGLPPAAAGRVVDCRGINASVLPHHARRTLAERKCRIFLVDAGAPDIAASQIRRLASSGRRIDHLVPASVNEYIRKLQMYGGR